MVNNLQGKALNPDGTPFPIFNRRRPITPEPENGSWAVVEYRVAETEPPGRDLQVVYRDDWAAAEERGCQPRHPEGERWFRHAPEDPEAPCPESWKDITAGAVAVYDLVELDRRGYRAATDVVMLRQFGTLAYVCAAVMAVVAAVGLVPLFGDLHGWATVTDFVVRVAFTLVFAGAVAAGGWYCRRRAGEVERAIPVRERQIPWAVGR